MLNTRKRSLYKAALSEPSFQEQGVQELIDAAPKSKESVDALWQLLLEPLPPKTPLSLCAAVCQGILRLVLAKHLSPQDTIKRLVGATEAALGADENPEEAFGVKAALISPVAPYLALYTSTIAKLCLVAIVQEKLPDAAFLWTEQPPLIVALGLNPVKMVAAVLEETAFSRLVVLPPQAQLVMPALACPVIVSVLFQPQYVHYRAQLLQSLALLPFEYLPEPVITFLGLSWVHLLPFLPCRTTEDLVFLADWARLVFKAACHLEDHAMAQALCAPLVAFLVKQALEQAQGSSAGHVHAPLLPLLLLLERVADYDASLVLPHLGFLAYLTDGSAAGDERGLLLRVLELCSAVGEGQEGVEQAARRRWAIAPLLTLMGREEGIQGSMLTPFLSSAGATLTQGDVWTRPGDASLPSLEREVPRLSSSSTSGPRSRRWALFLLSTRLLEASCPHSPSAKDMGRYLSLLEHLLSADPLLGARALPVLLHLLGRLSHDAGTQLRLLDMLTSLGRHQLGAMLVQALLRRLPLLDPPHPHSPDSARLRITMGTASLRLSTLLFKANSRTLPKLRPLLLEGSALSDDVDEYRLARIAAIADVIAENPEAGAEFIGVVQCYLTDPLPAITALAVDCITYLCSADCLDYLAALRILAKKGRLSHRDHPSVLANLADLYGAAVYIFDCSPAPQAEGEEVEAQEGGEGDEEEEEARPRLSDRHLTILTDNLWVLLGKEEGAVRARAWRALMGFLPLLLSSEEEGVADETRSRIFSALKEERDMEARGALGEVVVEVLERETADPATWGRALLKANAEAAAAKPSRKTVKLLPRADEVLALYRASKGGGGAASACLYATSADPSPLPLPPNTSTADAMCDLLLDALSDDDTGGRCPLQRLVAPQAYLRFLPALLALLSEHKQATDGLDPFAAQVAAIDHIEALLTTELHRPGSRASSACHVALASLANSLPPQLSHRVPSLLDPLLTASDHAAGSLTTDVAHLNLCLGLAGRRLHASQGESVLSLSSRLSLSSTTFASRTDVEWCTWGAAVGTGALTDWAQQLYNPDLCALRLLSQSTTYLLSLLQPHLPSPALSTLLSPDTGAFTLEALQHTSSLGSSPLTPHASLLPPTPSPRPHAESLLGAFVGIALLLPNLAHAGMERQVVQLYHITRAAVDACLPFAEVPLAAAASLGLRSNLLSSEDVFATFRLLTQRIDAGQANMGVLLGLANLVIGVQGVVTLPAGFVDDVRGRMLTLAKGGKREEEEVLETRIAALFAVYTLLGNGGPTCTLLSDSVGEGLSLDRSTSSITGALVEALKLGLESPSRRFAGACARVMGLLVALRSEGVVEGKASSSAKAGVVTSHIDMSTLGLPAQGTLAHLIMAELVQLAVGDLSAAPSAATAGRDFITSALQALAACPVLRFSHKQVTQLLQNFVKACPDCPSVVEACVAFALATAHRDNSYATWLYDVAVNASRTTVLDVVIGHVGGLVKIIPSGLVCQLLGSLWAQLWARPDDRYPRAVALLTSLADGLTEAPKPTDTKPKSKSEGGGSKGPDPATVTLNAASGVWAFVCKDLWPLGLTAPWATDLFDTLPTSPSPSPSTPKPTVLDSLDALVSLLSKLSRPSADLLPLLAPPPAPQSIFAPVLHCLLVERQVLPFSSLKPLLHRLIGPGSGFSSPPSPSPETLKVLPFLLRALLTLEASAAQQRDVILELLDFLQVQPCNLCPLFFLAHCLHGWYVGYSRFLLTPDARQDMGGCVASLLRFLQPDFKTAGPNQADDWAVLEGLPTAMAALYAKLSAEGEVEVLSRVVKVLGALPQHQRGRVAAWTEAREAKTNRQPEALVRRCMMGMIEAARGGQAIAGGALPSIRVLLAQYCLAGAVPV